MKKLTAGLALVVLCPSASAYPTTTHVAITYSAIANSNLQSSPSSELVANQLDLAGLIALRPDAPFWTGNTGEYVALKPAAAYKAANVEMMDFEDGIIDSVSTVRPGPMLNHSIESWILRGVIREDDNRSETPASEEPGGVIMRVFGHFYDAKNEKGLNRTGVRLGDTAKAWSHSNGSTVLHLPDYHPNGFNLPSAKEAMWRAVTGLTSDGHDASPGATGTAPAVESVRKAYWATTFRSLGNAIHLIEDMAQPQHTRNDAHSGVGCVWGVGCLGGHASYYEGYIGALTTKSKFFILDENLKTKVQVDAPTELSFAPPSGFDTTIFTKYSDFFSSGDNATGTGLANYSSRGFYSAGTNVGRTQLPLPDPNGDGLTAEQRPINDASGRPGTMTVYKGVVNDTVTQSSDPAVLTASGMWDRFIRPLGGKSYTLNRYVYDDQARLLLPRAVAYSTAFINFFFRGRMVIAPPDQGVYAVMDMPNDPAAGFRRISVKLSAPETDNNGQPQRLDGGILRAVIKFRRRNPFTFGVDNCLTSAAPLEGADACRSTPGEIVVSDVKGTAAAPEVISTTAKPYTFEFPTPLPVSATDVRLQVIYRDILGQETDEVVVATVNLTEPTFWSYMNTTDYFSIDDKVYTEQQIAGDQSLIDKVGVSKCIDSSSGTNQLISGCLQPITLPEMQFAINRPEGGASGLTFKVSGLAPRSFLRIAMLGNLAAMPSIALPANDCLPSGEVPVSPLEYEDYYSQGTSDSPPSILSQKDPLPAIRGVWQRNWVSCVSWAGGTWQQDNREAVFKDLVDMTGIAPAPVSISESGKPAAAAWPLEEANAN